MAVIASIAGSPSPLSRTSAVLRHAERRMADEGHLVRRLTLRELPAAALLARDTGHPSLADALTEVARADGVIIGTPVYKAACSGLLHSRASSGAIPQAGAGRLCKCPRSRWDGNISTSGAGL